MLARTRTTRTGDGTLRRISYDYTTLKLKGELQSPVPRVTKRRIRRVKRAAGGSIVEPPKPVEPLPEELLKSLSKVGPEPPHEDLNGGINFNPPVAFGVQTEGLSAIGHADQKVAQWEVMRLSHAEHMPRVLPMIDETLRKAREHLQALLDNKDELEANSTVV
jgi:hypothetical protein